DELLLLRSERHRSDQEMDAEILCQIAERSRCRILGLQLHDSGDALPVGVENIGHLGGGDEFGPLCGCIPNERRSLGNVGLNLTAGAHLYKRRSESPSVHALSRMSARRPARLSS